MPHKDPKERAVYLARWRQTVQGKNNRILRHYKKFFGCEKCGWNGSAAALQFHHPVRSDKLFNASNNSMALWRRIKEALKCDVLCANCHMTLEHDHEDES